MAPSAWTSDLGNPAWERRLYAPPEPATRFGARRAAAGMHYCRGSTCARTQGRIPRAVHLARLSCERSTYWISQGRPARPFNEVCFSGGAMPRSFTILRFLSASARCPWADAPSGRSSGPARWKHLLYSTALTKVSSLTGYALVVPGLRLIPVTGSSFGLSTTEAQSSYGRELLSTSGAT